MKFEWHNAKKEKPELIDIGVMGMKMSDTVLVIPKSCYDADFFIPTLARYADNHWQFGDFVTDDVVYWAYIGSFDDFEKQIRDFERQEK